MEEKIKNIISLYTGITVDAIVPQTAVDRSAVSSSILLHRMYASLAAEGYAVQNYFSIKNYGQLLAALNADIGSSLLITEEPANFISDTVATGNGIGIDVEEISSMPLTTDYRENEFYKMNFSPAEIAYCILQPDARASFAGLFAAKEAIIKADNSYQNKPFSSIIIDHLPGGKPKHPPFELSVSHAGPFAIAVAVYINAKALPELSLPQSALIPNSSNRNFPSFLTAFAALLVAILALLLFLFKTA